MTGSKKPQKSPFFWRGSSAPPESVFKLRRQREEERKLRAMERLAEALERQESSAAAKRKKNREAAKLDRPGSSDLPAGADLLSEYNAHRDAGLSHRKANAALYRNYPDVLIDTIRQKLNRARKKKL